MKKIAAILLVVSLLGALCACSFFSDESKLIGDWKLKSSQNDITSLTFKKDGVLEIEIFGLTQQGTYSVEPKTHTLSITYYVFSFSNTLNFNYTLENNELSLKTSEDNHISIVYEKVKK